jgi:alkylation response protein AidB-like acyl-CoA dehydrogenase
MERKIFEPEHDAFRATARRFFEKECLPRRQEWERDGVTSREVWLRAGELGLLGWEAPEKYVGLTTQEQKERWLPGCVSGEIITAIAMSELGAGSDLAGIGTAAVPMNPVAQKGERT